MKVIMVLCSIARSDPHRHGWLRRDLCCHCRLCTRHTYKSTLCLCLHVSSRECLCTTVHVHVYISVAFSRYISVLLSVCPYISVPHLCLFTCSADALKLLL